MGTLYEGFCFVTKIILQSTMLGKMSAWGSFLLLVVAVHTQQENDRDATDEVLDEIPWEDIPTQHEMDLQPLSLLGDKIESDRSICGNDTSKNAVCYKRTESKAYEKSRAVLRLRNGCTGWLVGDEGHILTNWHCIEDASTLAGIKFESMAEGKRCNSKCKKWLGCPGNIINTDPVEFIMTGGINCKGGRDCVDDYTLVKLSKKDAQAVKHLGYLKLRRTGPVLGERIYIPQHPAGWGKRIDMDEGGTHVTVHSISQGNVRYKSDTRGGSSGSPIIAYSDNAVIAIHNQGGCRADNGGTNIGVDINRVLDGLKGILPESAYTAGGNPSCKDLKSKKCPKWANKGYCKGKHEDYMKKNCKNSCNLCESGRGEIKKLLGIQGFQGDLVDIKNEEENEVEIIAREACRKEGADCGNWRNYQIGNTQCCSRNCGNGKCRKPKCSAHGC